MKKMLFTGLALFVALVGFLLYGIFRPQLEKVDLAKEADFYLIAGEGIASYAVEGNQLKELAFHQTDLSTAYSDLATLDGRYLLFSESVGGQYFGASYLYSLDTKEGILRREATRDLSYDQSFAGDLGLYSIKDNMLIAFGADGKERGRLKLEEVDVDYYTIEQTSHANGQLYLILEPHVFNDDEMIYSSAGLSLYQVSEADLTLVSKEAVAEEVGQYGRVGDMVVVGDNLYYTTTYYVGDNDDYISSNVLVALDLTSREKQVIELPVEEPENLYASPDGKTLLITNESYHTETLFMTVLDLETKDSRVLDLSKQLGIKDAYPHLYHLLFLSDDQLVMTTLDGENELIYLYDLAEERLLDKQLLKGRSVRQLAIKP